MIYTVGKNIDCEHNTACRPVFNASYLQTIYHHLFMASKDRFSRIILFINLLTLLYIFAGELLKKHKIHSKLLELEMTSTHLF